MYLPGAPADMLWNKQVTPASMFGINPGAARGGAGAALPPTSVGAGDGAFVPWSPDSPTFWAVALIVLTVAGVTGASVRVRAFKRSAEAKLGDD